MTTPKLFWGSLKTVTFPKQTADHETDYLIVGGGITGLAVAYFLLKAGKRRITIVERSTVGSGSTGHSAGMLVTEPEQGDWYHMVNVHGPALAKKYYEAHVDAATLVEKIITDGGIECRFKTHEYLFLKKSDPKRSPRIWKEYRTVQKALSGDVEALAGTALQKELPSSLYRFAERMKKHNVAVNPLLFARGFAQYLAQRGVTIFEQTSFLKHLDDTTIRTDRGTIATKHLFLCCGSAATNPNLDHFLTTIAITKPLTDKQLSSIGLLDKDMFVEGDGNNSFHYGRITGDNRLLIGFGDKRVKADTAMTLHMPHLNNIERFMKKQFPTLTTSIAYAWSAPYALAKGRVPLVQHTKTTTTIGGAGIQLGSIVTASYAVALVLKKPHPLKRLFTK